MTRSFLTGIAAALALTGTQALAATGMDADGDGLVTFDELLVAMPTLTEETFTTLDANGDGMLDAEEIAAAQESGVIPVADQG